MSAEVAPLRLSRLGPDSQLVVGGYRVERLLRRRSASDAVYEAADMERGLRVELRVVTHRAPERRRRFEADVAQLEAIRHPHLPRVYGSGDEGEILYLATASMPGVTLAQMRAGGRLPPMRAVRLLGGVADALDSVHAEGLAHGDVRLENVIVVQRHVEHPYLVDFELGGARTDGDAAAASAAGDVRALAVALREVRDELPPALDELLAETASGRAPHGSACALVSDAAKALMSAPRRPRSPAVAPAPAAPAPPAPAPAPATVKAPPSKRRPVAAVGSLRVPAPAGVLAVLAAGAAGLLLGAPSSGDEGQASVVSSEGVQISLPPGWKRASAAPRVGALELVGGVAAATPNGRRALVAGRLPGLRGSVYPAAVARDIDSTPGTPRPVRLEQYEALRFRNVDARGSGRLTLFLAPSSEGTVGVACLAGAPRIDCEGAAASLQLSGGSTSSLAAGQRFAARLERVLGRLDRRRSTLTQSLDTSATSGAQVRVARTLAGEHRTARRAVGNPEAPPAAAPAQERLTLSLRALERSYAALESAARRRRGRAFDGAQRAIRDGEAELNALLRGL